MPLDPTEKTIRSKFFWHAKLLMWKSVTQRRRQWVPVLLQMILASVLFLMAVFMAKPVFLTPVQEQPQTPITFNDMIHSLKPDTHVGYSPYVDPYIGIMEKVAGRLKKLLLYVSLYQQERYIPFYKPRCDGVQTRSMLLGFMTATSEEQLNDKLYEMSKGTPLKEQVIWVIWKPKVDNVWKFSIRCTELVNLVGLSEASWAGNGSAPPNKHLKVGFLAIQLAISEALLDEASPERKPHEITLEAMPTSPLMREEAVRKCMAWILLFFTVAFIPPVMEVSSLVVTETENGYKRALRIRNVDFSCLYIGWLTFAFITALPVCMLAAVTLIFMFRWILLFYTLVFVLAYLSVMTMLSLIMAMFHSKPHLASLWTALFTLLQLFLAELLVHHGFDDKLNSVSFVLHVVLPPLGLVHGFNSFALLHTGRGGLHGSDRSESTTILLWMFMILFYFAALMLLQRTIGQQRAIGGQVSWRSIIFKKAQDPHKLRHLHVPSGKERDQLQEVDDFVAKAISFRHVSKSIMGVSVLRDLNFDIYRGEYTMLLAERIQSRLLNTLEDLITGLTSPDKGVINVLGHNVTDLSGGKSLMTMPGMIGYCHRSEVLVKEFTVLEHLQFFTEISIWDNPKTYINEYFLVKSTKLLEDCDLEDVRHEYIKNLDLYYHAQLCWAIALLLEPRIIYVSNFLDEQKYISVINDKILKTRGHHTVLKIGYSTYWLQYADRLFFFDSKILVFGGTPAYMFFRFGREYRVRMTISCQLDDENVTLLLQRAAEVGAVVRAHLGSLLILRLPTSPTAQVAAFIKELTDNAREYGITSLNISLPDSEEVCRRAIVASRSEAHSHVPTLSHAIRKSALERTAEPRKWKRKSSWLMSWTGFKEIAWKFICFYVHYRFYLIITIIAAMVTGVIIGVSLSVQLVTLRETMEGRKIHGEVMTVESLRLNTTLVIKADASHEALSIATAYALSTTKATPHDIAHMRYTAIPYSESASGYLVLRAIDSPQQYVYMYAYGLTVAKINDVVYLKAMYSPIHQDTAAAARSVARMYMALLRHYSRRPDADIEVTDDPLLLDSSPTQKESAISPLIIQFMLIITISHITLLPSKEHGLMRHMQAHATNFSPACYWTALFFCDLILYWALVFIMSSVLFGVVYLAAPSHFLTKDLIVIPFVLIVYGLSCVPQAYLFSLGPSSTLNSMTFIIVNVVFGEATVVSHILYGNAYSYAERFLTISPQYNVATAFIRMTEIFVYNSECVFLANLELCSSKVLHKCCEKCGVMQPCFKRISYLSRQGILDEMVATLICGLVFSVMLALWEYQVLQRLWKRCLSRWVYDIKEDQAMKMVGAYRQQDEVMAKYRQMKNLKRAFKRTTVVQGQEVDTFGEYLLVHNVSRRREGCYLLRDVSFGIGKGQALALAGLKRHGRLMLCQMLAGYTLPSNGDIYAMSKWNLSSNPHRYARNVALCFFESSPLPPWMTVVDALCLIAALRGVPACHIDREVSDYIDALELHEQANTEICRLKLNEMTRLNFAAAAVGAPTVLVLDECTAYQKFSVNRAMYYILYNLRRRGHAIFLSSANVESHMPVTNQLAFLLDGRVFDIDSLDEIVARYSQHGFTVVLHLREQFDVETMLEKYFKNFAINDVSGDLVNLQILEILDYAETFRRMEVLVAENENVNSYVISAIPLDYIYNRILQDSVGLTPAKSSLKCPSCWRKIYKQPKIIEPPLKSLVNLETFQIKYDITTLKELPWSVIFQR